MMMMIEMNDDYVQQIAVAFVVFEDEEDNEAEVIQSLLATIVSFN